MKRTNNGMEILFRKVRRNVRARYLPDIEGCSKGCITRKRIIYLVEMFIASLDKLRN
jgi:hypothetical protein